MSSTSRILLAWELGGGWGHVGSMRPLVRELVSRGHDVTLAASEVTRSVPILEGVKIRHIQAPRLTRSRTPTNTTAASFAEVLANVGFDCLGRVACVCEAWLGLLDAVSPDLVIAEHAPTALLAARIAKIPSIAIGTGFTVPPNTSPLPLMNRPGEAIDEQKAQKTETATLRALNRILQAKGSAPLNRLADLYHGNGVTPLLRTCPDLDHFGPRRNANYLGAWPCDGGEAPLWPQGDGPRIFVYIRSSRAARALLAELARLRLPTIAVAGGLSADEVKELAAPTLKLESDRLDMTRVATECDYAILNGGHGTTSSMLIAGKPCLLLPLHMEQFMLARKVEALKVCVIASPHDDAMVVAGLNMLLKTAHLAQHARDFAQRYQQTMPPRPLDLAVQRVESAPRRDAGYFFSATTLMS